VMTRRRRRFGRDSVRRRSLHTFPYSAKRGSRETGGVFPR
jgi:hypothetical protein